MTFDSKLGHIINLRPESEYFVTRDNPSRVGILVTWDNPSRVVMYFVEDWDSFRGGNS